MKTNTKDQTKEKIHIFNKRNTIFNLKIAEQSFQDNYIYNFFSKTIIFFSYHLRSNRIVARNHFVWFRKKNHEFYNHIQDKNRTTRIKEQKRLIIEMSLSIERPHIIAPAWIRLVAVHRRRSKTHRLRCFTREQGNNSGDYWLGSNIISPIGTRGGQSGRETRFPVSRWFVDDAINSI